MKKTELVVVPSPGMGHLHAAVELAKLIVRRQPAVSVAVLAISHPSDAALIAAYAESQSREPDPRPARLSVIALPAPGRAPDTSSRGAFFTSLVDLNRPIVRQAVLDRARAGSPGPAAFVFDMFCAPMIDLADELGVPSYLFYASGVNFLNVKFHVQSLADCEEEKKKGVDRVIEELGDPDKESDLPGFRNRVPGKILPSVFLDREGGSEAFINFARVFRRMKGIVVNTFVELEGYGIEELMRQSGVPQVYPVGPVLKLGSDSSPQSGARDRKEEQDLIMEWLDQQPISSVVFLCFGSMGCFDVAQVKEIAGGLERSGHRFLWSLRRPPSEGKLLNVSHNEVFIEALPEGFLKRTRDRGMVIGWAPQVAILAHRSVGGFVSHCGWNSILESLWFGVPVATWPLHAEQQLNAFTMVKELELAVEIRMDYRKELRAKHANFLVTSEGVESGVKKLMNMDEERKKKVKEMSENARKVVEDGGSSNYWLGRFVEDILN